MTNKTNTTRLPIARSSIVLPPLSLYVHIPWCIQKCPYCDFNSHEPHRFSSNNKPNIPENDYLQKLFFDLEEEKVWLEKNNDSRKLHSIFFGGGTPSLFSAHAIERIIRHAEQHIGFSEDIEITLEANPGTFEQEKFSDFLKAGVNRLSIGVQSFQQNHLHTLGRIHNSDEAKKAIHCSQHVGFTNINIDLMHGLPEQTVDMAVADLQTAIAFQPQHISWYQLTIEPNTVFYRQPPPLPNDDLLADIQHYGGHLLSTNGFQQYEISAFSQAKKQAQHNINYWQFGDYIGIGAGAHGKLTDINTQAIIRRQKTRLPAHYLSGDGAPNTQQHVVAKEELALEFMMNALRLNRGVDTQLFTERTGLALSELEPILGSLKQQGLMKANKEVLATTDLGQRFLNSVLAEFE